MRYLPCLFFIVIATMLFSGCSGGIDQTTLTGKWKYVKVGVPNSSPPDTVTNTELQDNKPSIEFKNNTFTIIWGGKVLSHGSYVISGKNLKVSEDLGAGKKRDFQFYVSELSAKKIIFETVGEGGSRVSAVKE